MKDIGCLGALLIFVLVCIASWWIVYGILWLICWCFNLAIFSWKLVLGIWLVMWLLGGIFK